MTDLTEASLLQLREAMTEPLCIKPAQLIVSEDGLNRMKELCAGDAEFRKRVLAEFPQLEGII